ncbi:nematode cuticle collagen domain protein [Onchocerca flexuosa]|uniref:Nematode cuticle collagen domain protein n=1 Tax=Onchocerca flexuosa TaxID=387005 RepID=A0A238BR08_9BILA|nr:nematode cuticle collagen domain protein [Onchocerca flexuosa]
MTNKERLINDNKLQEKADRLRWIAFCGVTMSTVAILLCVISASMLYSYLQHMHSVMENEIEFYRSRSANSGVFLKHDKRQVAACCGCGNSPPGGPGPSGLDGKDGADGKPGHSGKDTLDATKGHSNSVLIMRVDHRVQLVGPDLKVRRKTRISWICSQRGSKRSSRSASLIGRPGTPGIPGTLGPLGPPGRVSMAGASDAPGMTDPPGQSGNAREDGVPDKSRILGNSDPIGADGPVGSCDHC